MTQPPHHGRNNLRTFLLPQQPSQSLPRDALHQNGAGPLLKRHSFGRWNSRIFPSASLQRKARVFIGILLVGLLGTSYCSSAILLSRSYSQLEHRAVEKSVTWVLETYHKRLEKLNQLAFLWSNRDVTAAFLQQPTQASLRARFLQGLPLGADLQVLLLLNAQGQGVYGESAPGSDSARALPAALRASLQAQADRWAGRLDNVYPEVVALPEGLLGVVARPVTADWAGGSRVGTLIMGQRLDGPLPTQTETATHRQLQVYRLPQDAVQPVPAEPLAELLGGAAIAIRIKTESEIAGYALVRDRANRPVLMLEVTLPREIYRQGQQNLRYLAGILLLVGSVLGITTQLLAHQLIQLWQHQRESERQLAWQATHDDLTNLVNRREFEHCLEEALQDAKLHGSLYGLCYLDLDQFKIINDTCGHQAGDELLRQVTTLLQAQLSPQDVLARLGGDEFGLLLYQRPIKQVVEIAEQLRRSLQEFRFLWQDKIFSIGVSIGVVAIHQDSPDRDRVLSASDAACYVAKNRGRNRVHVYQADDREVVQQRSEMEWVARLNQALEENRFCLYCQAIAPVVQSDTTGEHYEVLVRLCDESGRLVPPGDFIPAAERYNLMHLIDRWVIRTLFSTQGQHYRQSWERCQRENYHCLYAINLSGASINDDQFIDFLYEQFARHRVPPQVICFEITETVAITHLGRAIQFMRELKHLGCYFALDDFGSGMSSFGYLKNLPVDYLKIDGEFIKDIQDDPTHRAMTGAINQIGHLMGIRTIAEFVEDQGILEHLKVIGVDYAQGYGIAHPQPLPSRISAPERRKSSFLPTRPADGPGCLEPGDDRANPLFCLQGDLQQRGYRCF